MWWFVSAWAGPVVVEVGDRRLELPAAPAGPFALGRLYGDDVLKIGDVATDVVTLGVEDVWFPPKQLPTGPPPGTLYGPGAVQRHEIRGDLSILVIDAPRPPGPSPRATTFALIERRLGERATLACSANLPLDHPEWLELVVGWCTGIRLAP